MPTINDQLITQFLPAFLVDRKARGSAPKTIEYYQFELERFVNYHDNLTPDSITPASIREYLTFQSESRNPGGVHSSYRAIKAFLRWIWSEFDLESHNPIEKVVSPKTHIEPIQGVTVKEVRKLANVCHGKNQTRDKAIVLTLFDTALRANELVSLNWQDINLIDGTVIVRNGKGSKSRITFVGTEVRRLLRSLSKTAEPDDPVFISERGDRLTIYGLRSIIRRRTADAKLKREPGLHDFRRGSLLEMLRNKMDVVTVSRIAGHSDIRVTMRYLAQLQEDLLIAHRQASPVDNMF